MKFDRELWRRARPLFDELVELEGAARQTRLEQISAEDPKLGEAVERLLVADVDSEDALRDLNFDSASGAAATTTSSRDPLGVVGETVSHFRVKEYLAAGGMGVVYTAEDLQLARVVALKFPLPHQQLDGSVKERFINEARSAGALDHPNLCTVYEVAESEHGVFLVMPLYPGETLKDRIARDGALPPDDALAIVQQVTTGLASAHAAGIVHRDLKPGNVMLLPDGSVKVLDFGLAKIRDVSLTKSKTTLGTIGYVSPEQIRGVGVDARTDLWSIGVMLYEMLTGELPFRGEHEISIVHGILHREPTRASVLTSGLPRQVDDLIAMLLQKDPKDRYPSADALLADIAALRSGAALAHRSPFWSRTERRRSVRMLARLPGRSASLVAAALVVIAGGAALWRGREPASVAPIPIAVLPFTSLGDSASTYHLAMGMSDAIATDLAKLGGAVSPSYVTVSKYRAMTKSVKEIAAEQQVRGVLLGSVSQVSDTIHVTAKLFEGASGKQLRELRYDRPWTALQDVERDILRETAATFGVRLSAAERDAIARPPSVAVRAYDTYFRARAAEPSAQPYAPPAPMATVSIRRALSLYSQARDLDPTFALAGARLALMYALAASTYDRTLGRRELARAEAEAALRLRPDLAEAHEALGSYWDLTGDVPRAIVQYRHALQTFPHSASLHYRLASTLERDGRLEDALVEYESAMRLEPGNATAAFAAAMMNSRLRRPAEAQHDFNRALAAAPELHIIKVIKGQSYLRWTGVPDTLAALMRTVPAGWDLDGQATYARFTALWIQRRYADALAMLDHSKSELTHSTNMYLPSSLMRAQLHHALGEQRLARVSYAKARSFLQDSLAAHPGNPHIRVTLALALAGLGRKRDAVHEAHRAMDLVAASDDIQDKSSVEGVAVEVLAAVGETAEALELVERLLSMHAAREATVPFLRVWPGFDPLRSDARFEELLVRFAADTARRQPPAVRRPS